MILVDTSIWIDHLRAADQTVSVLLDSGRVLIHPFVIGELALGNLRRRSTILEALQNLPMVTAATNSEVMHFIEQNALFGRGVGYVDAHLLASTQLTVGSSLWTRDQSLLSVAERLGLASRFAN